MVMSLNEGIILDRKVKQQDSVARRLINFNKQLNFH